jgi:hypothetical protein
MAKKLSRHRDPQPKLDDVLRKLGVVDDRVEDLRRTLVTLNEEERWIGVKRYAQLHDLHPCTVRRAIARGELASRRVGRRVLVRAPSQTGGAR